MSSVALLPSVCAACKQNHSLEVREELISGQLKWFERFDCRCGHGFETGGAGFPSAGLRKALIAQLGLAQVWVDDADCLPKALSLLVERLGMEAEETRARFGPVPVVVFEGTHLEAAYVSERLATAKVTSRVVSQLPHAK